ncbi:MAG TPA: hypothetical protein ENK81_00805 [Euryarchaeota archaeon]|nr:hypothetical protein [Euryarchaeota archaeon]
MSPEIELLCKKLRETVKEFGQESIDDASIIGCRDLLNVSDVPYIYAPTISEDTLAGVQFDVARFFEDV